MTQPRGVPPVPGQLLPLLEPWIARQRWYPSTGSAPRLRELGRFLLAPPAGDASAGTEPDAPAALATHLILDESADPPALYQVPIAYRLRDADAAFADGDALDPTAVIGRVARAGERTLVLVDGPRDPAYAAALLGLILGGGESTEAPDSSAPAAHARGDRAGQGAGAPGDLRVAASRVLSGEQSNTSIIYAMTHADGSAAPSVICKVFRALHAGANPDVQLQTALSEAGSVWVPTVVGHVEGEWTDASANPATGQLAFAQQFVDGVEDAWRVALSLAEGGEDFADRAAALGVATAEVHAELARLFPTVPPGVRDVEAILDGMRARFAAAVEAVPTLDERTEAVHAVFARAAQAPWPALQRIHGDYHLGQVLWAEGRGWVLLDFEGEPLRPMTERARPDIALRDVAGMLRSFDYVAGTLSGTPAADRARAWAEAARAAFLRGYLERSGLDLAVQQPLLDAFELDKAAYEAVYEARNRPDWLPLPVGAIARLTAR